MTKKKEVALAVPIYIRQMPEYTLGKRAYSNGVVRNPYVGGDKRTAWWTGWLDARTNEVLKHVFDRNNLTFP